MTDKALHRGIVVPRHSLHYTGIKTEGSNKPRRFIQSSYRINRVHGHHLHLSVTVARSMNQDIIDVRTVTEACRSTATSRSERCSGLQLHTHDTTQKNGRAAGQRKAKGPAGGANWWAWRGRLLTSSRRKTPVHVLRSSCGRLTLGLGVGTRPFHRFASRTGCGDKLVGVTCQK